MREKVIEYKKVLEKVNLLIKSSPYKKNYIIKKTGMSSPTFYRKLKNNSFTPDELLKIIKLIGE